jgi:hypothetical protein
LYDLNKYGPSEALLLAIVSSGDRVVCPFRMATTILKLVLVLSSEIFFRSRVTYVRHKSSGDGKISNSGLIGRLGCAGGVFCVVRVLIAEINGFLLCFVFGNPKALTFRLFLNMALPNVLYCPRHSVTGIRHRESIVAIRLGND